MYIEHVEQQPAFQDLRVCHHLILCAHDCVNVDGRDVLHILHVCVHVFEVLCFSDRVRDCITHCVNVYATTSQLKVQCSVSDLEYPRVLKLLSGVCGSCDGSHEFIHYDYGLHRYASVLACWHSRHLDSINQNASDPNRTSFHSQSLPSNV